jgi:hypothetical protein
VRKIVISGLVAVAAVLGSAVPAVTASAATTGQPAVRVPAAAAVLARPAAAAVFLTTIGDRISCASPTACLAVGTNTDSSGTASITVAERLHGTAWKSVAVKAPAGATATALTGVSCKAATYCLVVGEYGDKQGRPHPAAWAWNGTTLTAVAAPSMPAGIPVDQLTAVSCVAVKSCVAFGTATGPGTYLQLIWTWNGKAWARRTATLPGDGAQTELSAAHCFSLTACEVAGTAEHTGGSTFTENALFAAWNGKAFTAQRAGAVGGATDFVIVTDLSCLSPSHCAAVGGSVVGTAKTTITGAFAQIWNGKTWTATKWAGPKGTIEALLFAVSCTSASSCVAVGGDGNAKATAAASLVWNGTRWSVVAVPRAGAGLSSVFVRQLPEGRRLRGNRRVRQGKREERQAAGRLLERQGLEAQGRVATTPGRSAITPRKGVQCAKSS